MNQKREMPENIRKMFEQRKLASNNSSNASVQPVAEQIKPSSPDAEEIKGEVKTEQKEQISQNNDLVDNTKNDITQDLNNEVVNDQPIEQPKQDKDKKAKIAKPKKEKIVKEKKQKEQKEKKKLSKKAKTIITISAIAFVLIITVIVLVIMLIPKVEKMNAPKLKVYTLSNQVMFYVDENENADYYEFYIQKSGDTAKRIPSQSNVIYISSMLNNPNDSKSLGKYTIWARYGSKNEKAVSDISNKEVVVYTKQLDKINDATLNLETNELTFSRVNNAISYRIYYGAGENEYITQISPTSIGSIKVNLADKLQAGNYNLTIQAIADANRYYTNSELSSSINFVYKTTLRPITSATYTKSTSNLTLSLDIEKTNTSKFKISIKFKNDLNALSFEKQFNEVLNSQTLDLSLILSKYSKVSSDVDSITIIALGSEYVNNSTEVYATIYD